MDLVLPLASLLLAALTVALSHRSAARERQANHDAWLRDQRLDAYAGFLGVVGEMGRTPGTDPSKETELAHSRALLVAPVEIREAIAVLNHASRDAPDSPAAYAAMGELLLLMAQDVQAPPLARYKTLGRLAPLRGSKTGGRD